MQVGIDSFAAAFDENSRAVNPAERLRQLVQQIEHADEVGIDAFGVGEHHRREFLDSAPAVILGAAAARTQRIRLTSAVTVLSAEDPVRAFQNFANFFLMAVRHRGNHRFFVFEVPIDQTDANAGFGTDIMHAGLMKPAFGKADYSGIKDLRTSIWTGRFLLGL